MPENDDNKSMRRLADPRPELKRFNPLNADEEGGKKPLEQTWGPDEPEPESKGSRAWTLTWVGILVVAILTGTIVVAKWSSEPADLSNAEPEIPRQLTTAERRTLIENILREFLGATETEQRVNHILQPDRLRPMVDDYYTNQNPPAIEFAKLGDLQFVTIDDHPWCWAAFEASDSGGHLAAFKEVDGGYRLDWESFVAYGEMSFEEFVEKRPEQPVQIRAYLSRANYHNHKYQDPESYVAYKLAPRDPGPVLFGYVPRESPLQLVLSTLANPGERQPVNLRIRCEADAGADNLVVIDELIHTKWTDPSILKSGS